MTLLLRDFVDALNTRLVGAQITREIAWPNSVYVPKKGVSYLAVEMAGRARTPIGFGADGVQQWSGIYQVSVFVPRDAGDREQDALVSKVLAAFPRGLNLPTPQNINLIVEYSSAPSPVVSADWSSVPTAVHWFATETTTS
jgi:hypothetical protein